ncbi:hypothetical protein, partial [Burkholderia pseudomallei]|uniref:hypothetical protein n=2 Tax=Burkholderia pseudomallei TaxID=28450 RepID=UPI001F4E1CA2
GVWRLAFGVWRLAFGVWRFDAPKFRSSEVPKFRSSEVPTHRRIAGSARLARARQPINGIYAIA